MPQPPDTSGTVDNAARGCANESCEIDSEYEKFVFGLASSKDTKTFSNRSASHALSILRNVFKFAEKDVKIFCGSLESCVYNDPILLKNATEFLDQRKGKIQVLIQNEIPGARISNDKDFLSLVNTHNQNFEVKVADANHMLKKAVKHFLVADGSVYRMELDISEHTAVCSFNDETLAPQLNMLFDAAWGKNTLLLAE